MDEDVPRILAGMPEDSVVKELYMLKTMTLPKTEEDETRYAVELDHVLRQIGRRLKRMKRLDAEIERLRARSRASLDRLKVW